MAKPFFEVFPTLEMEDGLKGVFSGTLVERVATTRRQDRLRIDLSSDHLIDKQKVHEAERQIRRQLFGAHEIGVKINEHFRLPEALTPQELMERYRESLLRELHAENPVCCTLFRSARLDFSEDGVVTLALEDTVTGTDAAPSLARFLDEVLNRRFGYTLRVETAFYPTKRDLTKAPGEDPAHRGPVSPQTGAAPQGGAVAAAQRTDGIAGADNKARPEGGGPDGQESAGGAPAAGGMPGTGTPYPSRPKGRGAFRGGRRQRPENPDVLFRKDFTVDPIPIADVDEALGEVCVRGQIVASETRVLKNERVLLTFDLTDYTDTMTAKLFLRADEAGALQEALKPGACIALRGLPMIDRYDRELEFASVSGIKKIPDFTDVRSDRAQVKRAELHCHTKMSDTDGVSEVKDIVRRAYEWGMPGIAITDHGVVQALTDANHVWEALFSAEKKRRKEAGEAAPDRQDFFKIVLGTECYLVDDLQEIVTGGDDGGIDDTSYVVFDLETTGFSPKRNRIIEIGALKLRQRDGEWEISERFSEFVNPQEPIPARITELTSITDEMVQNAPTRETLLPRFAEFCKGCVLVGHNVKFDISFIAENCRALGLPADYTTVDTLGLSRVFFPLQAKHTLDAVAKTLKVQLLKHHRAVDDAACTAEIFLKFLPMLREKGAERLSDINTVCRQTPDSIRHLRPHHCVLLAKNTLGRVHLYTLISKSHLEYFHRYPLVPKSLLMQYREGLIVGSACSAGELFEAVEEDRSEEAIAKIVSFYDYLEIQPVANNAPMIDSDRHEHVTSEEDLRRINRRIVALGEQYGKPVAATGDVHFLDERQEVFRKIIRVEKGFYDETDAPLYFRTTDEMLEEFAYLGEEKAREVVVTNSRRILDMCESISPVRPDKCVPVIADSDRILKDICYEKAHAIYGDPLPEIVKERLKRELKSIISNGFAVMYIIAQKLVWKSVEDGYLVGSRGSVGSSLVAFLAGITEVNALSPHYICPHCKYSDFDSPQVRAYAGKSGCDMPDRVCPECGTPLKKDGFDIPFETFLGFKGDKEPDIDLNFSGEYQSRAHQYTEVIFGKGQTYRAGTIATMAEKTAYGYVRKYYEKLGVSKRKGETNRIVQGCSGVRRGTGQHPGGIIVLPVGEDINSFCPVQHPANDMSTPIVTTHYDYHSIDHNLLKLDILGHDDPTMIRFLYDATGIDPQQVPLDDRKVMSLFENTEALGITPEQIGGTKLGCLALPEFGTDFAMQMVMDARPTSVSHLIRIAGLAHGTDVWLGNAQKLLQERKATIDTAICTRDDIMLYLIQKGMDKSLSFKTMESVRKGKGLTPEMEAAMNAANVPDWYIWSCKKIKYMFPKAHAAAYVMMAWRIAWFKVYQPIAFYAAWFSIRAKSFSYRELCQNEAQIKRQIAALKDKTDALTNVEEARLYDMRVIEEMYARGISFMPIELYRAKARRFQIFDGKIMPSFNTIDGMGEKVADAVEEEAAKGEFISRDDFRERTKAPQTVIDLLGEFGILTGVPESNQISLFDLI